MEAVTRRRNRLTAAPMNRRAGRALAPGLAEDVGANASPSCGRRRFASPSTNAAQGRRPRWPATRGSPRRCDSPTPRSTRSLLVRRGSAAPQAAAVVCQQPSVVRSAQFGDRRWSRPFSRRGYRNRGEPVVRSSTEAIARRPTATSRGSTCASSGPCSRPPAHGRTAECVAEGSSGAGAGGLLLRRRRSRRVWQRPIAKALVRKTRDLGGKQGLPAIVKAPRTVGAGSSI